MFLYMTPDKATIITECDQYLGGIYIFQSFFSYVPL